jgi:hypothetical protein
MTWNENIQGNDADIINPSSGTISTQFTVNDRVKNDKELKNIAGPV